MKLEAHKRLHWKTILRLSISRTWASWLRMEHKRLATAMCSRSSGQRRSAWRTWGRSPSLRWLLTVNMARFKTGTTNTHPRSRMPIPPVSISTIWMAITSSRRESRTQIYCLRTTACRPSSNWITRGASASGSHTLRKERSADLSQRKACLWSDLMSRAGATWTESMARKIAAALSRTHSIATEHKINLRQ